MAGPVGVDKLSGFVQPLVGVGTKVITLSLEETKEMVIITIIIIMIIIIIKLSTI